MFFYKEPYKLIFHYIFFLSFIIIFIQFSTAVHSNEVYKIDEIEISEKFEQDFNKNKIINRAFRIAFNELISKITLSTDSDKLNKIKTTEIKNLVEFFAVTDEKFINNLYVANYGVESSLHILEPEGVWTKFSFSNLKYQYPLDKMVVQLFLKLFLVFLLNYIEKLP